MTIQTDRPRRRDAAQNRDALLAAARTVLNRDPDAPLDAIATEAGLTRRAVYGHFATRDELLRELLALGATRVVAAIDEVAHPDPLVRLALIGSRLWAEVASVRVMAQFAVRGPFQADIAAALVPLRASVLATVRAGAASGRIRDDIPAEQLARLIEGAALSVLDEATRSQLDVPAGARLVTLSVLSLAGLSAADAYALMASTPELDPAS